MVVLRRHCHVHFSQLYPYFVVKKSPFHTTEFCDHKDEHTNHYNCLNNSYYQMPMWFYACMGVCCNSPLLGRRGVRKMSYSKEHKEHIEYTFAAFCRVVLRNAALSAYRDINRRRKHEISLDYLMSERYYNPSVTDNYFEEPMQPTIFSVCGECIEIENERLAKAFSILSKQRQEVLVLYFFFRYTDKKIGQKYGRSRTTVNYWKLAALKQLRKEWERLEHEERKANTF